MNLGLFNCVVLVTLACVATVDIAVGNAQTGAALNTGAKGSDGSRHKPPHPPYNRNLCLPCAQPSKNRPAIFELKRSKILGKIIKKVKAACASVVCNATLLLFEIQIYLSRYR